MDEGEQAEAECLVVRFWAEAEALTPKPSLHGLGALGPRLSCGQRGVLPALAGCVPSCQDEGLAMSGHVPA